MTTFEELCRKMQALSLIVMLATAEFGRVQQNAPLVVHNSRSTNSGSNGSVAGAVDWAIHNVMDWLFDLTPQATSYQRRKLDHVVARFPDRSFASSSDHTMLGRLGHRETSNSRDSPSFAQSNSTQPGMFDATRPKLTNRLLFVLGAINLIDCINVNILPPYVVRLVSDFLGRSPGDPRVAGMVGYLLGVYSLCEVIFSVMWGRISDRFGRKPALLCGLAGSIAASILFGLAQNLPMAFIARICAGFFCGNVGVTKTYMGEVVDQTNEARGFSFLAVCFSLGILIGPLLGGQLVFPAVWAPRVFEGTIFKQFPYLLPNLCNACLAAVAWTIGALFLEETLPRSQRKRSHLKAAKESERAVPVPAPLINAIAAYCSLSGCSVAWVQNFCEVVSLPREKEGFALTPREIGRLQTFAAMGLMMTQLFLYARLTELWGLLGCFVAGWTMNWVVTIFFPVYGLLADPHRFHVWRYVPLAFLQFFGQIGFGFCYPTCFVWINREARASRLPLGEVNGWCNTLGALFRGVVPPFMANLLSLGLWSGLPGGRYLAIFVNNVLFLSPLACALVANRRSQGASAQIPGMDEESVRKNLSSSRTQQQVSRTSREISVGEAA